MRIIAGTHKGMTIYAPAGDQTRATADKVRGAVFNMLQPVAGMKVLDLFAGSGAMALEALSRGAAHAVLVDNHPAALKAISRNITKMGLTNSRATRRDYQAYLKDAAKKGERYDLIFVDPPYKMHRVIEPVLRTWLPMVIAGGGMAVIESDIRQELSLPGEIAKEKVYGDTKVRIFHFSRLSADAE